MSKTASRRGTDHYPPRPDIANVVLETSKEKRLRASYILDNTSICFCLMDCKDFMIEFFLLTSLGAMVTLETWYQHES